VNSSKQISVYSVVASPTLSTKSSNFVDWLAYQLVPRWCSGAA